MYNRVLVHTCAAFFYFSEEWKDSVTASTKQNPFLDMLRICLFLLLFSYTELPDYVRLTHMVFVPTGILLGSYDK